MKSLCIRQSLFFSLPLLLATSYIALFSFYLGSTLPAFVNSILLFLVLFFLTFYSRSILYSPLIIRLFISLFTIGLLTVAASNLSFSILKGFFSFAVFNFCYGIIVSLGFCVYKIKYFYLYLLLILIALGFSFIFFLTLPDNIEIISGILNNPYGGNDLYQSFGGYFLRLALPPWFFVFLSSHKTFQSLFHLPISFLPRLLLLSLLFLSLPVLFALGVKKELVLLSFMIVTLFLNLLFSNKLFFLCSSFTAPFLTLLSLHFFAPIRDNGVFIYCVERFMFSFDARFADFVPTFGLHLAALPFGDPSIHILANTPNYIHSSIISSFIFGGLVSGLLFLCVIFQILLLLPGFPLPVSFFIVSTIMLSAISTTYEWLFLWFLFGILAATKVIFGAFVFEDTVVALRAQAR